MAHGGGAGRLVLAPMEGLADALLRDILSAVGGIDLCVTEFVRITDQLLPPAAWLRRVPELTQGGCTAAGVPVKVQLLGADPACLADNAARAAELGAPAIDLNFGCPAPTVNRHRGGAVLLAEPELLGRIAAAVRAAVPAAVPVSAKMRLGISDTAPALACAQALAGGGIDELTVHARTKADGYRPPAYWEWIARIREAVAVNVVANGEIWSAADALRCRAETGCADLMLGRGLVTRPGLALAIRAAGAGRPAVTLPWPALRPRVAAYFAGVCQRLAPRHAPGRLKLWLSYLRAGYPEAAELFARLRTETDCARLAAALAPAPQPCAA
ncbi:tRNA-U20a,U20b-dihydrouridine synthase [Plasticicumulans lactativorans]|uniref:tRNA-dihydrouridine(16) synthase n=1 Tax=Plasticicumulans lactativorans TaxID=1133106 RepID=A0A4R2KWW7_9GAMM|nr:tRNA-dihydrouridine synthase [Plasticicumulans lactativorans]TCO77357.1 tRNA-U20a,U20b-dihydrouridine synthase [Plasticicumulans lactativorans]